ncbi:MAG: Crp/Fnr family transcriptional regulator [Gammaproteobacteria bacterium]|jgi:CRP/FNR family cyclic AMP-dependent transcriptional regulator
MSLDSPLFPELTSESLKQIAAHGTMRTYPKNTVLIHEGDQTDSFYVILKGKVKVYASDEDGKEIILNIQGAGKYFGELALIDSAPRSASVMTMEPSKLAVVSRADFEGFLTQNPRIAIELIRSLAQRVRSLTESVKSLALLDVYGRVARTLLDLATEEEGELAVRQRLTHQDIANMVGASREMVSRIMKDLTNGGYIRIEDRRISIRNKLPPGW